MQFRKKYADGKN